MNRHKLALLTLSRGPDNYYTVHSITGGAIE